MRWSRISPGGGGRRRRCPGTKKVLGWSGFPFRRYRATNKRGRERERERERDAEKHQ